MKEKIGFVYVLTNTSMPGIVKIGLTKNIKDRIINLSSNGTVSSHSDSSAHTNSSAHNNKDGFQSVNNVKPRENFEQYYCNVDTRFDNTNLLKTKNLVDAGYRNFPYDDSLTRFISIDTENGKMQAINTPSSCPS